MLNLSQELAAELKAEAGNVGGELHAVQVDLSVEAELEAAVAWVKTNLGGIDVLINNAGVFHTTSLAGGSHAHYFNDSYLVAMISIKGKLSPPAITIHFHLFIMKRMHEKYKFCINQLSVSRHKFFWLLIEINCLTNLTSL